MDKSGNQTEKERPRKNWIDNIQEDCSEMGLTPIEANKHARDRNRWRFVVAYKSLAATARRLRLGIK